MEFFRLGFHEVLCSCGIIGILEGLVYACVLVLSLFFLSLGFLGFGIFCSASFFLLNGSTVNIHFYYTLHCTAKSLKDLPFKLFEP